MKTTTAGLFVVLVSFWGFLGAADATGSEPGAKQKKVLVIGIDGCRPDALKVAKTPQLDALVENGGMAQGTRIQGERFRGSDTVSGPGWSSILTGVWADKHGVLNNDFKVMNYDKYPCFFHYVKKAMPKAQTVAIADWPPIIEKIVSSADVAHNFANGKDHIHHDNLVCNDAVDLFARENPTAMFVYFGNVDSTGHKDGFHPRVPKYIEAIERVDGLVGRLVAAIAARKTAGDEDWLVIVTTDHGGRGKSHGKGHLMPDVMNTFLIVSGPSAARGKIEGPTAMVDVVPTALAHLGIEIDPEWKLDGKPVGLKKLATAK